MCVSPSVNPHPPTTPDRSGDLRFRVQTYRKIGSIPQIGSIQTNILYSKGRHVTNRQSPGLLTQPGGGSSSDVGGDDSLAGQKNKPTVRWSLSRDSLLTANKSVQCNLEARDNREKVLKHRSTYINDNIQLTSARKGTLAQLCVVAYMCGLLRPIIC